MLGIDVMDQVAGRTFLTVREFASQSGIGVATVWRYLHDGKLPKYQPGGRGCRVVIPIQALHTLPVYEGTNSMPQTDSAPSPGQKHQQKKIPGPRPKWPRTSE